MGLCTRLLCASLLPLAGPVAAKARAPQEDAGLDVSPFANVFLDAASFQGYGARYDDEAFSVRLAEFGVDISRGGLNLRAAYDFAHDGAWRDLGVFWKKNGFFIGAGQFKEPASLEKYTFEEDSILAEPAAFTAAFGLTRRTGVVTGRYTPDWSATGGVFLGSLDGTDAQGRGPGQSAIALRTTMNRNIAGGRLHLGGYARGVDYDGAGYTTASYPGSKLAAKTLYADFTSDAADGLAEDSVLAGLELAWSRPGFHIQAETGRQSIGFATRGDGTIHGASITASWAITGETRPYIESKGVFGAVAPARPVTEGGPGAVVASARVDHTDFDAAGAGRTTRFAAGLAWIPRAGVSLEGELGAERGGGYAGGHDSETMMVRLRLTF